ncbi:hypothetical protein [Kribbella pratensis]|uniref:hypothetical protein n=1 Tax=Kribbella pratensis TaxID=2512112 RepID=UPI001064B37C|nr:hypothetical protein [Kribbella pratensis]
MRWMLGADAPFVVVVVSTNRRTWAVAAVASFTAASLTSALATACWLSCCGRIAATVFANSAPNLSVVTFWAAAA